MALAQVSKCYSLLIRRNPTPLFSRFGFYGTRATSFEEAKNAINKLKNEPDNETKLQIYALFKQITVGDCSGDKPSAINFIARAKWQAWDSLRSMPKDVATKKYIETISDLMAKEEPTGSSASSAPSAEGIEIDSSDGILRICFNRPDKKNAITPEMYRCWATALNEAASDPQIKVAAVTGKGDYFSSGNDLNSFTKPLQSGMSMNDMASGAREILHQFVSAFIDFPKPLVGLINGPAVGITVTTLGMYDYVLATEEATFHTPFVALGQTPEGCSSITFPRIMGPLRAKEMLLFGRLINSREAYERGLVTRIVSRSEFANESEKLLQEISRLPPQTMGFSKSIMSDRDRELLHETNRLECDRLAERWIGPECMQAISKFFDRPK